MTPTASASRRCPNARRRPVTAQAVDTVSALRLRVGTGLAARASIAIAAAALMAAPTAALGASGQIRGQVQGAGSFPRPFRVTLFQAMPGASSPKSLGSTTTQRNGSFSLRYRGSIRRGVRYLVAHRPGGAAEAGYPVSVSSLRLATALGDRGVPGRVTVNERTTVATAFALAQFFKGGQIAGKNPGLRNAAAMTRNLASRRNGGLSPVLSRFPNGGSTTALATANSLANLVATCRRPDWRCARLLHYGAAPGSKVPAPNTLRTMISIARNPWHDVRGLFRLSQQARRVYGPALTRKERIPAWTLALRFEGVPKTMNGPGNIAIDARGSLWVINNYEYTRDPLGNPCAGEQLLRFTPTGRGYPGSPYEGGGLNGAGFGVSFDPKGRLWVGNFGFEAKNCTTKSPKNSVSLFNANGEALSPDLQRASVEIKGKTVEVTKGGFEQGGIDQPQGVVSDREGNIWIANCGNSSVTRYVDGEPEVATNIGSGVTGLEAPFDIAVNAKGTAFVTGNGSNSVAILAPDGKPTANSPVTGHGLHRPMGIATDSRGYMWVANSAKVVLGFCPEAFPLQEGAEKGSVVLIKPNGEPFRKFPFRGAGMETPWGITVDGKDTVWVANFTGQRLSQVCGARPKLCPPGKRQIGKAISPSGRGYAFNGLTRNTGVQVDPSGNVWLANNWKQKAIQTNPGGYQLVAYLGIAAPIKTPLIGPPERP